MAVQDPVREWERSNSSAEAHDRGVARYAIAMVAAGDAVRVTLINLMVPERVMAWAISAGLERGVVVRSLPREHHQGFDIVVEALR
jgi:hypothetical protein